MIEKHFEIKIYTSLPLYYMMIKGKKASLSKKNLVVMKLYTLCIDIST